MIRRQLVPKTWSNHSAKSEMPPSTPWHTVGSHPNRKPLCETHTFEFLYMVVKLAALLFKFITEWSTSAWCMFSICFQGIEETWCYVINSCSVWLLQLHWDMTACLAFVYQPQQQQQKRFLFCKPLLWSQNSNKGNKPVWANCLQEELRRNIHS